MNAIQPSHSTRVPSKPRRRVPRIKHRPQRQSYGAVAGETTAKLLVNLVLCAAAITALMELLPYHLSQQAKLREVKREVKRTETRVNNLRREFSRSFDPRQAQKVMREQSLRRDPNQLQVVWQDPDLGDGN
ncbi:MULTISPECIES: hypothetical protein [Moorena]|uniref:slr1601 family putative cell division protein n=1 Tax=Moorena TaxID=1155738 RepID=UPI00142B854B|nr:hypothetical protein [Moorena sp. SIO4G3]NEO78829.1 hypothetical protein [Moorena sp. SIO4G3]